MKNNPIWLCDDCYKKIGREVECYTDTPFLHETCELCGVGKSSYHVCNDENISDITESESPYCKTCGSCGDSGCCSPFKCLFKLAKLNKDCKYGEGNIKEVKILYDLANWILDTVDKKDIISAKEVNRKYRELNDTEFNNDTVYNMRNK